MLASDEAPVTIGQSPDDAYVPGAAGQISYTTDGGTSWESMHVPTASYIEDVAFPKTAIGYAVNLHGKIFRTLDGGTRWVDLSGEGEQPTALLAPTPSTVLLIGPVGVRRSTDAATSFGPVNTSVIVGHGHGKAHTQALSRFDLSRGAQLVGDTIFAYGQEVLESTDLGEHWKLIPRPLAKQPVEAISYLSATDGYEISAGRLFFTRDSGHSWRAILGVGAADIQGGNVSFSSVSDGYVNGLGLGYGSESILRTEDGGRSWTPEQITADSITATGVVDYASRGVLDSIFRTTDGGRAGEPSTLTLSISGPHRSSARESPWRRKRARQ